MKVLAEGFVLDKIPADPDTHPQPTTGQEIDIGGLPGNERRLALRKNQDSGGKTDPFGQAGQIGEHDEGVVEWIPLGIGTGQRGGPVGMDRSEHMVIRQEVVEPEVLDRSPELSDGDRIPVELNLRIRDSDVHGPVVFHAFGRHGKGGTAGSEAIRD